jgi:CheY-like chemotaxis protein
MGSQKKAAAGPRILVVDDDPQVRRLFARKLRSAGYSVSEAQSGRQALDVLRGSRFDLLVLDLEMPDTDGFEVLKSMRSEQPHLRVLVISGYMQGGLLKAAEWFGATATIDKVTALQSLVETARRLLGEL